MTTVKLYAHRKAIFKATVQVYPKTGNFRKAVRGKGLNSDGSIFQKCVFLMYFNPKTVKRIILIFLDFFSITLYPSQAVFSCFWYLVTRNGHESKNIDDTDLILVSLDLKLNFAKKSCKFCALFYAKMKLKW